MGPVVTMINKTVDIYLGNRTKGTGNVPRLNDGDVHMCKWRFAGKISNLIYYNQAILRSNIRLYLKGPGFDP